MTELRWYPREDGTGSELQARSSGVDKWENVPMVEREKQKKPREWVIESFDNRCGPYRAWESEATILKYQGEKPDLRCLVRVREILE